MGQSPIIAWEEVKLADFGTAPLMLRHSLASHPLFAREALARVIESAGRADYYVNTMDLGSHDPRSRREGEMAGLSGEQVLEAVAKGTIWILLLNPAKANPAYNELLGAIYEEMHRMVPGFRTRLHKMTLLISSPKVQVHYHCDIPGQTLWQVAGTKQVRVYPNRAPFLNQAALERIALGEVHEFGLPYDPAFESEAKVFELTPGHMLHWPLNAPHRIVNGDCVNVSFTTEHFTASNRRKFIVNRANGVLRKRLGERPLSQDISGPAYWAKFGVAAAHKLLQPAAAKKKLRIDFALDPKAERAVRTIPAYEVTP